MRQAGATWSRTTGAPVSNCSYLDDSTNWTAALPRSKLLFVLAGRIPCDSQGAMFESPDFYRMWNVITVRIEGSISHKPTLPGALAHFRLIGVPFRDFRHSCQWATQQSGIWNAV